MDNFICRVIDLPHRVNAVVVLDESGFFNIYVNSHLSEDEQKNAFIHEKKHIIRNHLFCSKTAKECEIEAKQK